MSSELLRSFSSSLSIRVTAWFVGIFTFLLLILLLGFYFVIKSQLYQSADTALLYELDEAYAVYNKDGLDSLGEHIVLEAEDYGQGRVFFRVFDAEQLLFHSDLSSWGSVPVNWTLLEAIEAREKFSETILLPKSNRYIRVVYYGLGDGLFIQTGVYLDSELEQLANYRNILPIIGLWIVLLAGAIGFFIVHRLVLRVKGISRLAEDISSSNLNERLPLVGKGDEIDELATGFNQMLDRIETLVLEIRQVSDNVAHDLRSPIARMRAGAEVALRSDQLNPAGQEVVVNTIEECDRVLTLVNSMLDISQVEAETMKLEFELLDLSEVVHEAVELFEPVASDKSITIQVDCEREMLVEGNLGKLQRAVANLIDNAIKFSANDSAIALSVTRDNEWVIFVCKDSGIGISQSETEKVFNRFYRCDGSRTTEGSGLGLTLCRSLIRAHGGSITLESEKGRGTTVSFKLPRPRAT